MLVLKFILNRFHVAWASVYSRVQLLSIGLHYQIPVTSDFQQNLNHPLDVARCRESFWIAAGPSKLHRERKQKRGCSAGLLARLDTRPLRIPLTSIFLTNTRSIGHKIDELDLYLAMKSFTWLHQFVLNTSVKLAGHTIPSL